jgi:hypothetical protein
MSSLAAVLRGYVDGSTRVTTASRGSGRLLAAIAAVLHQTRVVRRGPHAQNPRP